MIKKMMITMTVMGFVVTACAEVVEVSNLVQLVEYAAESGNDVRMVPGTYVVDKAYSDDPKVIFNFSGSSNSFDFSDVRFEINTQVYADMPNTKDVHGYMGFRIHGDHIKFSGAEIENIGEEVGPRGNNEFVIFGNDFTMTNCAVTIRGSSPFGYGDLYGKGRGSAVRLQKHALMSIIGDRALIDDCDFKVFTYGHGIHMHGCQNTVIRNVKMLGMLRLTDTIYAEKTGPAAEHDYKIMYPEWKKGEKIPKGEMLSLTEDGIRAYLNGTDKYGNERRTGHITVENCTVVRMRGGITLALAGGATVTGCMVRESGGHAYALTSNAKVRDCKGDAAFGPLLSMPYSNRNNADIELELVESKKEMGDHPLIQLTGNGHRIKITYAGKRSPKTKRQIIVGTTGARYTEDNTDRRTLSKNNGASNITLINETPHSVYLTEYASNNEVITRGSVKDRGDANKKKKTATAR